MSRVFTATGVALLEEPERDVSEPALNWDSVVEGSGYGLPSTAAPDEMQKRLTALEAARASAMADLVEKLAGVRVSRHAEVRDLRFAGTETRVAVEGVLTGVKVVESDYDEEEGMARVVLRVGLDSEGNVVPERLLPLAPLSLGVRRAQAEEAARYDAIAKLREQLGGAYVTQEITVKDLMFSHQRARLVVEGIMLSGVEFAKPVWPTSQRCEIEATLKLAAGDLDQLRALAEPVQ